MSSSLDNQIAEMRETLKYRKMAVKIRSDHAASATRKKLSSPAALCFAAGTGFFIGKLSDRPKEDCGHSNSLLKVFRIVAGVQTAQNFAKHL